MKEENKREMEEFKMGNSNVVVYLDRRRKGIEFKKSLEILHCTFNIVL